jgi:iron complex outermembrane receptor protein
MWDDAGNYLSSNGQENDQSFHSLGLLAQHRQDLDFLHSRLIVGVYADNSPSSYYAKFLDIQKDVTNNFIQVTPIPAIILITTA